MKRYLDVLCLSHVRWNDGFGRPQHLLSRCARNHRVFYIEEPIFQQSTNKLLVQEHEYGVIVVTPVVSPKLAEEKQLFVQRALLTNFLNTRRITEYISWYYTPTGLDWLFQDNSELCIYDCTEELSNMQIDSSVKDLESRLLKKADLVFTADSLLYQRNKNRHQRVFDLPGATEFTDSTSPMIRTSDSWEATWKTMSELIGETLEQKMTIGGTHSLPAHKKQFVRQ